MIKLGSHNTMTYLEPKHWYMKLFSFIYQCQDKTFQQQYNEGIRYFDIRIAIDKEGKFCFAHGLVHFKSDMNDIINLFKWFNELKDVYVRLIFEEPYENDSTQTRTDMFLSMISLILADYKNIKLIDCRRKYDWQLLVFDSALYKVNYNQFVSSMNGKWYNSWWPRLFAKKYNANVIKNSNGILFVDFINQYN